MSSFQFRSYKVDKIDFDLHKSVNALEFQQAVNLEIKVAIRRPIFFEEIKNYVVGIDLDLDVNEGATKNQIAKLQIGIAGVFFVTEKFSGEIEENLVKHQAPTLLFSYLRSTVTNILINAGFPAIILPLINIHEVAKTSLNGIDIEVKK